MLNKNSHNGLVDTLTEITNVCQEISNSSRDMTDKEASSLAAKYYNLKDQIVKIKKDKDKNKGMDPMLNISSTDISDWLIEQFVVLEKNINHIFVKYTKNHPMNNWMKKRIGFEPILIGGFFADFKLKYWVCVNAKKSISNHMCSEHSQCMTECHEVVLENFDNVLDYIGFYKINDITNPIKKNTKYNLKNICSKIALIFERNSRNPASEYGVIYKKYFHIELDKNRAGSNTDLIEKLKNKFTDPKIIKKYINGNELSIGYVHANARHATLLTFLNEFYTKWKQLEANKIVSVKEID